jgi:hypothetical protein
LVVSEGVEKMKALKRIDLKIVSAEKKGRRHWVYRPVFI